MKYGFPFMGSKSRIACDILNILPSADNFYDLFAGGGAIAHCALLSGKYKNIIANDIQGTMTLFLDAVNGKYKDEKRWISREQFFKEKENDPYIRWIWSFGNSGNNYLFGKDIEKTKEEAHNFLIKNGYDRTREKRIELIKKFKEEKLIIGEYMLERLQQLERLERLQQLEQLQRLQRLEIHKKDYREIDIKEKSVVYCDIPYNQKVTTKKKYYGLNFDAKEFYSWAKNSKFPIFFSSCFCDDAFFKEVWSKEKISLMNNKNSAGKKIVLEKIYYNNYL